MTTREISKACSICGEVKPLDLFCKDNRLVSGRGAKCKNCKSTQLRDWLRADKTRAWRYKLRSKYGLAPEEYYAILESQGGGCAICGTQEPKGRHNTFHVDHDHATSKVRGILCHSCNTSLGHFNDSTEVLQRAITYLEKTQ